jgi:hypothetical protein
MYRSVLAALLASLAVVLVAQSAGAYPPEPIVDLIVDDTAPAAGGTFVATARCVVPEEVVFTFNSESKTSTCQPATAGFRGGRIQAVTYDGIATATFRAPDAAGSYPVTARLLTTGVTLTTTVVVAADPTTPPLPPTGGGSNSLLPYAAASLVMGGGLVAVALHRRRLVKSAG